MSLYDIAMIHTEYRVVCESEPGHITEYDNRKDAEKRAEELNGEHGVPNDHYVVEHTERV